MQRDLYSGFSDDDFRAQLDELEERVGRACDNYTKEHTDLFLTVQDQVLPRYGFDRGQRGVIQMLKEVAQFNDDKQFQQNRAMLNELLGLTRTDSDVAAGAAAAGGPRAGEAAEPPAAAAAARHARQNATTAAAAVELLRCPQGHSLSGFLTDHSNYTCDRCGAAQVCGSGMHGCRRCDWDLCALCWNKERQQAPRPATAAAAAWGELVSRPASDRRGGGYSTGEAGGRAAPPAAPAVVPKPPLITEQLRWRPASMLPLGTSAAPATGGGGHRIGGARGGSGSGCGGSRGFAACGASGV